MSTASSGVGTLRANARQAYDLAVAGAIGALTGLYLYVELVHSEVIWIRDALAGVAIGGAIGFLLNVSGPLRDGAWFRLARSVTWGAIAGALGGAVGLVVGEFVLGQFQGGLIGRAVSWGILGLGIGVSQGIVGRSQARLIQGMIGGVLGGFLGGFVFEWIRQGMSDRPTFGQAVGILPLGAGLGLFLALVEQALRRTWVQIVSGRQEGRACMLTRKESSLGLDEWADVGLFGDPTVARQHARIELTPTGYTIRPVSSDALTRVNGSPVGAVCSLKDGDRIELGQTQLIFRQRG